MRMGVVADDLTGSHDIGIMFAKAGFRTEVHMFEPGAPLALTASPPEVCILNTGSRLDPPAVTYDKVKAAVLALQDLGCRQFFGKTSSAFVGPVGAQFDALLDTLGEDFAVVVVGFPKNGRTTIDGVHYVHGIKLEDSEFRNDPAHPMSISSLVDILQVQTSRKVGLAGHRTISSGPDALKARLATLRSECSYVVLDVLGQPALRTIAQACVDSRVICGSSAIAEELAALWPPAAVLGPRLGVPEANGAGVLCVAGSLMPQTGAQIQHLRDSGAAAFEVDTCAIFDSRNREAELDRLASAATCRLKHGQHVIVHSPNSAEMVERTREAGRANGKTVNQVSRQVSAMLAEVAAITRSRGGLDRLIVAGGETSSAVCERLGVRSMEVLREIQPGLPSCLALTTPPLLMVLKSGSFGTADFFEQAIAHLGELQGSGL